MEEGSSLGAGEAWEGGSVEVTGSGGGSSELTSWLDTGGVFSPSVSAMAGIAQIKLITINITTHNAVHLFTFTLYNLQVTKPYFYSNRKFERKNPMYFHVIL